MSSRGGGTPTTRYEATVEGISSLLRFLIQTMEAHGIEGVAARVWSVTVLAASPMTSIVRTTAKSSNRSVSRFPRSRPLTNCPTESAASIMCRMRILSSSRILCSRASQYFGGVRTKHGHKRRKAARGSIRTAEELTRGAPIT